MILLGLVIGLVLGAIYYLQKQPVYQAEAQVLVVQKHPEAVTGQYTSKTEFEDYASTHRVIIKSPIIVQSAIENADLGSLKCLQNLEKDLLTEIIERLNVSKVSRESESILELSFRGTEKDECPIVVNSILQSYQQFLADTYRDVNEDTVTLITDSRNLLRNELMSKEKAYRAFREDAPMIWSGEDEVNPRQHRLALIDDQRSALLLLRAELEGKLTAIQKAKNDGKSQPELLALISDMADESYDAATAQNEEASLKAALLPLLMEEKRLLADYGSDHPYVETIRERIETTRNFFALPSASYVSSLDESDKKLSPEERNEKLISLYFDHLTNQISRLNTSERVLSDLYETELGEARKLNSYELQDEEYRTEITRTQALYDGLIERLQDASLVKDYGGFDAQVIAPAAKAEIVAPRLSFVGAGSVFVGLLLGVAMAYFAEYSDRSFRSPDDVSKRLELPIIGHIPTFAKDTSKLGADDVERDRMLCSHYKPRSTESEAFRSIRTAIYFSSNGQNCKVIQVTSSNPSDGKSTVTSNLAVSIAKSNKRVLLIDADLRKPRQHKIFGVDSRNGLAAAIAMSVEPPDAIVETGIENLSLMPAGALPPDPAELLSSPKFAELLEVLREKFDYVIIDTAPLLAVTDPSIVSAKVDGVLLTIRISNDGRSQAERSKQILKSMNANVLGVVVNAIDANSNRDYYQQAYGYEQQSYYGEEVYAQSQRDEVRLVDTDQNEAQTSEASA